jgi:hypothetical protein
VINPELKKDYSILVKSKIFDIIFDSLDNTAIKIRLVPLQKNLACGQGAIVTLISLGQLPVLIPDRYTYTFQEIYPGDSQFRSYDLHLATRYWFWDIFAINKNFSGKAGQILSAQYFATQKTPANTGFPARWGGTLEHSSFVY